MLVGHNNYWLGTLESYQPVLDIQKAKSDGTLLKMRLENPNIAAYSDDEDERDFRCGLALLQIHEGVAVINIQGGLVSAYAWYNSWFGVVSYEEIRDAIMLAAEDDNVKTILLNMDSPGGAVAYLDELADFIRMVDAKIKPVHGHTTSCACSAAFWLLSSCRRITASKAAMTGSIGVLATHVSQVGRFEQLGVEFHYIRSGEYKALGQSGEDFSKEAEAEMSKLVMGLFKFFMAQVLQGRGSLAAMKTSEWNTGKVFLSEESLALGLIDEINTFDSCIAKLYKSSNNSYISLNDEGLKGILMKHNLLTKEQAAKFAAGTPVESLGLTAENLAKVKETIEKHKASAGGAGGGADEGGSEGKVVDAKTGEGEAIVDEPSEKDEGKDEPSADAETIKTLLAENAQLNKAQGKLEEQLEVAQAATTQLQESTGAEISALKATQEKLVTIAAKATNKLQVSIGAQATNLEGVEADSIITQYDSAEKTFDGLFNVGARSKSPTEGRQDQASLQQPKHKIKKVAE